MKLYLAHVGFYDPELGIYELHTNFFVVAEDPKLLKKRLKTKKCLFEKNAY